MAEATTTSRLRARTVWLKILVERGTKHTVERDTIAMAAAAPPPPRSIHRCFLGDVPATVERLLGRRPPPPPAAPRNRPPQQRPSPRKRPKVHAEITRPAATTAILLRLLGTVVELRRQPEQQQGEGEGANSSAGGDAADSGNDDGTTVHTLVLDDGTGFLAEIRAPAAMAARIGARPGMAVECVVRVVRPSPGDAAAAAKAGGGAAPSWALHADQLAAVRDAHAESLRWLELSHRRKTDSSGGTTISDRRGYPCRAFSAEDLYQVIVSDCCGPTEEEDNDNNQHPGSGVSLEDLSRGLDLPRPHVEGLIEELQISGQIYRNPEGCYLPL